MGKIVFSTTNNFGVVERVRFTAGGAVIFWMEDWPAGRIETNGGPVWAGRGTNWDIINNTIKLHHQIGEGK